MTCERKNLAGRWRFSLDPNDAGVEEAWWRIRLADMIHLPGSLQGQGYGFEVTSTTKWTGSVFDRSWQLEDRFQQFREPGQIKVPFWLQPDRHYLGAAWYQRDIEIPAEWHPRNILLFLERCHWQTQAWFDEQPLGASDSLATPHEYMIGRNIAPGKHRLTIRVDNRLHIDVGPNAHSVSDHVQTNWNGIIGRLELQARGPVHIDRVQAFPDLATAYCRFVIHLCNYTGAPASGRMTVRHNTSGTTMHLPWEVSSASGTVEAELVAPSPPQPWDEFSPSLDTAHIALDGLDATTCTFGWRDFATRGTQFTINGHPLFLRGTVDSGCFPLTGYPAMDIAEWQDIFNTLRAHGLNHVRYHSWCPPESAFRVADAMGFYLQVECGVWANQGAILGEDGPLDHWLFEETDRILQCYGNHPSFVMLAHGNEPAGPQHEAYLRHWLTHCRTSGDGRRLYTTAANYPNLPENQFQNPSGVQQHSWGQGVHSPLNRLPPTTDFDYQEWVEKFPVPVVGHEVGQWCAYPNLDETAKYTGTLKARNYEIFRHTLDANAMSNLAREFTAASGALQSLCYRHEIEAQLRTPGLGGFQLLGLQDFPGQGTAPVGMLDVFWDAKDYHCPSAFRRYCGPTVALARMPARLLTTEQPFVADLLVAHYGRETLNATRARWCIVDDADRVMSEGQTSPHTIPRGSVTTLGRVQWSATPHPVQARYRLIVSMECGSVENDWSFWVYPADEDVAVPSTIRVSNRLSDNEWLYLEAGGSLVVLPQPQTVPTPVQTAFSPIYWNTAWTINQGPHTLGILCDPRHPALQAFPTSFHSDWPWWDVLQGAAAMVLDALPPSLQPVVRLIDDWHQNRRLALAFEARVGHGRVLVCSADLSHNLKQRPAARQFLRSLLSYAASDDFLPEVELTPHAIKRTIGRSA